MQRRLLGIGLLAGAVPVAGAQDDWGFRITPYIWVATLTGDIGADGVEGSTGSGYSLFALENLDRYASLHFEARTVGWGLFADALAVGYEDRIDGPEIDTSLGLSGEIFELGGRRDIAGVAGFAALGGMRMIDLVAEVALTPGPSGRADDRWADPFFGLQYRRGFAERWYVELRGDVGGGVAFDWQAQLIGSVGYQLSDRLELFGGYRYLTGRLDDRVQLDITADGLGLGFSWSW